MIHRFPSAFELTSTNFQEVMRGSTSDLVVIAPLIKSSIPGEKEATQILTQTNKDWADKLTTPNAATLHATFVWMDIDRWDDWLKNTYGFKWSPDASPRVILADHKVIQISRRCFVLSDVDHFVHADSDCFTTTARKTLPFG